LVRYDLALNAVITDFSGAPQILPSLSPEKTAA